MDYLLEQRMVESQQRWRQAQGNKAIFSGYIGSQGSQGIQGVQGFHTSIQDTRHPTCTQSSQLTTTYNPLGLDPEYESIIYRSQLNFGYQFHVRTILSELNKFPLSLSVVISEYLTVFQTKPIL